MICSIIINFEIKIKNLAGFRSGIFAKPLRNVFYFLHFLGAEIICNGSITSKIR